MKTAIVVFLILLCGGISMAGDFEQGKSECIYASRIDQMISFYQSRLYLLDSEYPVLSDIGKDAVRMISYLQSEKEMLVKSMAENKVDFRSAKMKSFIMKKARNEALTYEAYSSP